MAFLSILGLALVVSVLLIIIRKERPEIAIVLGLAATGVILLALLQSINQILTVFESVAVKAHLNLEYFKLIVKIVGVAYLAGFGAQICKDAGEGGMAAKIELAGKISILTMGIPLMVGLLEVIMKIF